MRMRFWIPFAILTALFAAVLELNKNMLLGWILAIAVLVGFFFLRKYVLADRAWLLRTGGWVALVAVLAAVLVLTPGPYKLRPAVEGKVGGVTPVYTVAQGDLTGVYTADGAVEVFAGIPYAKPPVGDLRWKAPQAPDPSDEEIECYEFGYTALQYEWPTEPASSFPKNEDCLTLNIWEAEGKSGRHLKQNPAWVLVFKATT